VVWIQLDKGARCVSEDALLTLWLALVPFTDSYQWERESVSVSTNNPGQRRVITIVVGVNDSIQNIREVHRRGCLPRF
jgi:hypothetical protein